MTAISAAPRTLRGALSSALCWVFSIYAGVFCVYAYRALGHRDKLVTFALACSASLLSLLGMLVPNKEHELIYRARMCQNASQMLCIVLFDRMLDHWLGLVQKHTHILGSHPPVRALKVRWAFVLVVLLITYIDPNSALVPFLLLGAALYCSERLGGQSLPTDTPAAAGTAQSASYVQETLVQGAKCLSYSAVCLCASNGAYLCFHLVYIFRPKLGDLDFQYLGFFTSHVLGTLPFATLLFVSESARRMNNP